MREIKFRTWSELDDKMYQCDMQEDIQDYVKHDDGITLEQYTGIKDKNGNDIYEGDIVLLGLGDKVTVKIPDIFILERGPGDRWMNHQREIEIVGNVHQEE